MPFWKKHHFTLRSRKLELAAERHGVRHPIYTIHNDVYIGEWKHDVKSGKGIYLSRNKILYEGDFDRNYRHGFGVMAFPVPPANKMFELNYRGDWINGKKVGFGCKCFLDGGYYEGYFKRNKRHGDGQMWYKDGSFYDGQWHNDMRQGLGIFVETNGNRYEGQWVSNKKQGRGRFFHLDNGQMHEGVWINDICVASTLEDIPYRNAAIQPTPYPIPVNEVINYKGIIEEEREKRNSGESSSCLNKNYK